MVAKLVACGHHVTMALATVSAESQSLQRMTPAQRLVFDDLLGIGKPRPSCSEEVVRALKDKISRETSGILAQWTEKRLFMGKSHLMTALRCEGQTLAQAEGAETSLLHPATAAGIVTHRAIQLAHTHPGKTLAWYVEQAISASRAESAFSEFWENASPGGQSDLKVQSLSRTTAFLDTFPPLADAWSWRFEEPLQARVGSLVLAARIDLVLGRPRSDGQQTMFLCDLKTGSLNEQHELEAGFYALVATLRNGVAPYRSTVLSLASGDWTPPDVTPATLTATADAVIAAVRSHVEVLTETRPPVLSPGRHCSFCPAKLTCPEASVPATP